jgi:hypothetical protein
MNGPWIYAAVAALHLPGIAILAFLLRNLADSDPPDAPDADGGQGGGPPRGWRWRRRPHGREGLRPARTRIAHRRG